MWIAEKIYYQNSSSFTRAYQGSELVWERVYNEAFRLTAKQANSTVGLNSKSTGQTLQYSTDLGNTWSNMTTTTTINLSSGDTVYIRGTLSSNNTASNYTNFKMTGNIKASGNINYLWNYNNPDAALKNYCGYFMFYNYCTSLTDASELILPSTSLTDYCYYGMFAGCRSLTTAPTTLPATVLANSCYWNMFSGCILLTKAPSVLPATTLADSCYRSMFQNCSGLTELPDLPATGLANNCYQQFAQSTAIQRAPELPATTLVTECYYRMFSGCTNLNYIKCLATDISASNCTYNWVSNVASSGTFVKASSMTGWTVDSVNGIPIGWTVVDNDVFQLIAKADNSSVGLLTKSTGHTLEYKLNGNAWTNMTTATTINLSSGDTVYIRGVLTSNNAYNNTTKFTMTGNIKASGNVNYLWNKNNLSASLKNYCGYGLFSGCTALTDVTELKLSSSTLSLGCYMYMFANSGINTSPVLPATTLATACYAWMFYNCTSLTTAPVLGVMTLADSCYGSMFEGCSSLVTAPNLPATTLGELCYDGMFKNCTSLVNVPTTLPAQVLPEACYQHMFMNCTSLTTAPILPSQNLGNGVTYCYAEMFAGCSSLNYIKCYATTLGPKLMDDVLYNTHMWLYGVSPTGTFYTSTNKWPTDSVSGIPSGWTVIHN